MMIVPRCLARTLAVFTGDVIPQPEDATVIQRGNRWRIALFRRKLALTALLQIPTVTRSKACAFVSRAGRMTG